MISLLRQRNFSLLWFGGLISFAGDWVLFVALPLYIYALTGSVLATGILFVVNTVPGILLGSVAGVYADRWDRKQTLVITNLMRAVLILALLWVNSAEQVWIVYVVGFIGRSISQFMFPAENALLPKLVGEDQLVKANALNSLNNNLARLIGPAAGGVVVAVWGFAGTVLIDAASFLVAAVLIALISAPASVTRATPDAGEESEGEPEKPSVLREWREGLAMVARNHDVAALFFLLGLSGIAEGFISVLMAIYVTTSLGGGELEFGWLLTAQAVGGLAGGMIIGRMSDMFTPSQLVGYGFILLGIIDVLIFTSTSLPFALIMMVIVGVPIVGLGAGAMTIFQTSVPDRFRGRVMGAFGTTQAVLMVVSQGIASLFGSTIGIVPLLTVAGIFDVLAGFAAFAFLTRRAGAAKEPQLAPAPSAGLAGNTTAD
jgi:MFS family permease